MEDLDLKGVSELGDFEIDEGVRGMKYEDLTYEEKQAALAEANEMMKPDEVKLADIKGYVESCRKKFVNPYLAEEELDWLISKTEKFIKLSKVGSSSND